MSKRDHRAPTHARRATYWPPRRDQAESAITSRDPVIAASPHHARRTGIITPHEGSWCGLWLVDGEVGCVTIYATISAIKSRQSYWLARVFAIPAKVENSGRSSLKSRLTRCGQSPVVASAHALILIDMRFNRCFQPHFAKHSVMRHGNCMIGSARLQFCRGDLSQRP